MEAIFSSWIFWLIAGSLFIAVLIQLLQPGVNRDAARKIKDNLEATYAPQHEYASVEPEQFPWVDRAFYERTASELEGLGFRRLADMENLTLSRANPQLRTFIRIMTSKDGDVSAGIYDIKIRGWMKGLQWIGLVPKKLSTVDLETEFEDGRFLITHNSPQASVMKAPPQFEVDVHPCGTSADRLLEAHLVRLRKRLAAEPGARPCVIRTLDDALASQKRQEAIKHAHRKGIGWVTREEMDRLAMPGAKGVARDIHAEIRKLDDPKS